MHKSVGYLGPGRPVHSYGLGQVCPTGPGLRLGRRLGGGAFLLGLASRHGLDTDLDVRVVRDAR